jgi:hypothetical protein
VRDGGTAGRRDGGTAGRSLSNTITAPKNAQLMESPLVPLGDAALTALQRGGALQSIARRPLVMPHVKRCLKMRRVRELGAAADRAFALACVSARRRSWRRVVSRFPALAQSRAIRGFLFSQEW